MLALCCARTPTASVAATRLSPTWGGEPNCCGLEFGIPGIWFCADTFFCPSGYDSIASLCTVPSSAGGNDLGHVSVGFAQPPFVEADDYLGLNLKNSESLGSPVPRLTAGARGRIQSQIDLDRTQGENGM